MTDPNDWRLQGQEKYLKGVTLIHRSYRRYSANRDWDHDHCAFCQAKFEVGDSNDAQHQGYASENDYWWICENCFAEFKDLFEWTVVESPL